MKCGICKAGETHPGKATVSLQRGECVVVIREVPAEICKCGEYYLNEMTARRVYADAELVIKAERKWTTGLQN